MSSGEGDATWLQAINMDGAYNDEGDLLGILGLRSENGLTELLLNVNQAQDLVEALTIFIDAGERTSPRHPSPEPMSIN